MAAYLSNTIMGTIPKYWLSKGTRETLSAMLFARDWTLSNQNMVWSALNKKWALGNRGFSDLELGAIQKAYQVHLVKGITQLMVFNTLASTLFNGVNRGDWNIHPFWERDVRNWLDIDTGKTDKYGRRVYAAGWFWRYIRDVEGIPLNIAEGPSEMGRTILNKMEPLLKQSISQIANVQLWNGKKIVERGTPWPEAMGNRLKDVYQMLPIQQYTGLTTNPLKPSPFDIAMAATGSWTRHGNAPGSKATDLGDIAARFTLRQQQDREQIRNLVADKKIADALKLASKNFDDPTKVVSDVMQENRNPEMYRWQRASNKEKAELIKGMKPAERVKFLKLLQGQQ